MAKRPPPLVSPPTADSLALYVHWPWCLSKCPYCDFNSRANVPSSVDQDHYRTAILQDLKHYASQTSSRTLTSVFFGGGTPSLLDPDTVHAILETASDQWAVDPSCEITLEANPTSVEAAKFRAFRDAGVNRVSVGVQALNDEDLQRLGREHSVEEALGAVDIAQAVFDRYSIDLIYARPGQGEGDWADELEYALGLVTDHISLYQLTVEPGTDFFRQNVSEAEEDMAADLYQLTQEMCDADGLPAYEVSNHARPGAESRHNLSYWQGGDYIGIGPGAHGRITQNGTTHATHQIADPARWLAKVDSQGHGTAKSSELTRSEREEELILTGLRLSEGLNSEQFEAQTGTPLMQCLNGRSVENLSNAGLLEISKHGICTTDAGRLMLNGIIAQLLDDGRTDDPEPDPFAGFSGGKMN
ncbi:radical SAM family heme chaperone HemW [Magnetovibrio sp. PR-2]|uniref:radical SAM family heme chaperone HemW n=1 Tax=Magnetovibrio sp. PR-2 TaxID=3120356 RepID=UPI002FCE1EA6